jgi:hypothetical protein
MLLKVPRKFLKFRWLQICQGLGVGSIPIGRSILSITSQLRLPLRRKLSSQRFQIPSLNLIPKANRNFPPSEANWRWTSLPFIT